MISAVSKTLKQFLILNVKTSNNLYLTWRFQINNIYLINTNRKGKENRITKCKCKATNKCVHTVHSTVSNKCVHTVHPTISNVMLILF